MIAVRFVGAVVADLLFALAHRLEDLRARLEEG